MVTRATRGVSWIKAARQAFEQFPEGARRVCLRALTVAAEGGKADIAKPLRGWGPACLRWLCLFAVTRSALCTPCNSPTKSGWFMPSRRNRRMASRRRPETSDSSRTA